MNDVRWVVQSNLLGDAPAQWAAALAEIGVEDIVMMPVHGSDHELPPLPGPARPTAFFGSSRMKVLAARSEHIPGVWFEREQFHARTVADHWGRHMLNNECWIGPLGDGVPAAKSFARNGTVFVRPADNLKYIKGSVLTTAQFADLVSSTPPTSTRSFDITLGTEVLIAPVRAVTAEWRCFVAGGRVIAASQYLLGGIVTITRPGITLPDFDAMYRDVLAAWGPAPIYALDIGRREDGEYRIVEVNCFNSSGLYGCDPRIVFSAATTQAAEDWAHR